MLLMTLWRCWHARNEVLHNKPMPAIECSRRFLCSYLDTLLLIKQEPLQDPVKGKVVVHFGDVPGRRKKEVQVQSPKPWVMPT